MPEKGVDEARVGARGPEHIDGADGRGETEIPFCPADDGVGARDESFDVVGCAVGDGVMDEVIDAEGAVVDFYVFVDEAVSCWLFFCDIRGRCFWDEGFVLDGTERSEVFVGEVG